jgi:hypothetical protein
MFADPVLWTYGCGDEPQETDFIMALTPEFARRHDVHFLSDEGWTNPTTVRHVIQALRERNNPSYVPKPRPFIKEALTPFEAYQKKVMPYFKDHIQMEYKKETNWLVTTIVQDRTDVVGAAEALDWVGRIFAYSFRNNGRFMARVVDEDMLELWVSFLNDEDKAGFTEDVREDGYRDPDDDIRGFHSPQTLDYLSELSSLTNVFNADEDARIQSAAQTEPKLQAMMRDLKRPWKAKTAIR